MIKKVFLIVTVFIMPMVIFISCSKKESAQKAAMAIPEVPAEYKDKHMPDGWWTDEKVVAEGKYLYDGKQNIDVNCGACHGMNGMPVLSGSRDLRDASLIDKWSDGYWLWKVSEGIPDTAMTGWKDKLTEEEIWKVIAYSRTFSKAGK